MSDLVKDFMNWREQWKASAAAKIHTSVDKKIQACCQRLLKGHSELAVVHTKVLYVGRVFLTNMEKHLTPVDEVFVDGVLDLSRCLQDKQLEVDDITENTTKFDSEWTLSGALQRAQAVQKLNDLIKGCRSKNMYSFCSKYLYAHTGNIYIYDRNAEKRAKSYVNSPQAQGEYKKFIEPDDKIFKIIPYGKFSAHIAYLGKTIQDHLPDGEILNMRELDFFLYFEQKRLTEEAKKNKSPATELEKAEKAKLRAENKVNKLKEALEGKSK